MDWESADRERRPRSEIDVCKLDMKPTALWRQFKIKNNTQQYKIIPSSSSFFFKLLKTHCITSPPWKKNGWKKSLKSKMRVCKLTTAVYDKKGECSVNDEGKALPSPAFADVNQSTFHLAVYKEKSVHTVCIENFINQWMSTVIRL